MVYEELCRPVITGAQVYVRLLFQVLRIAAAVYP